MIFSSRVIARALLNEFVKNNNDNVAILLDQVYLNDSDSGSILNIIENENYKHPELPKGTNKDIIRGLYKIHGTDKPTIRLFGSGPLMGETLAAAKLLKNDWGVDPGIWNVTSFSELRRNAEEVERWNLIHSKKEWKIR